MSRPRLLVIMGSGETSPTMVEVHKALFKRVGDVPAIVLDTPFGFQENADELAAKAVAYFEASVGRRVEVAGFRSAADADATGFATVLARLRGAGWLFSGPGSPTYALATWRPTAVPDLFAEKMRSGGVLVFASAAALTVGLRTVPVYEIYKAGHPPHWLDGLDLLSSIGLPVAVIPHYDNTEGGTHDTRFCYLGERRLAMLERELPEGAFVLGVDEHTAVVLDLDADTATVAGRGSVTVRAGGRSVAFAKGETVPIDVLRSRGERSGRAPRSVPTSGPDVAAPAEPAPVAGSLAEATASCQTAFDRAIEAGDGPGAASAALDLERAIVEWSTDSLQSDAADRARAALRVMIVRLGDAAAAGLADPAGRVAPFVEALLAVRASVRAEKRFDLADLVRDRLVVAGVEVRDTPAGVEWSLK